MDFETRLGLRAVSVQAVLIQFERALREFRDSAKLPAWLPNLGQYGPDLPGAWKAFPQLARSIAHHWLGRYMFPGLADAAEKAGAIVQWLADPENFRSPSKLISRWEAGQHAPRIQHLEPDYAAQEWFLSVYHLTTHTFSGAPAAKIIENHPGKAIVKLHASPQPSTEHDASGCEKGVFRLMDGRMSRELSL